MFIYEVIITSKDDGYQACVPDVDNLKAEATTEGDALEKIARSLKKSLQKYLLAGEEIPEPSFGRRAAKGERITTLALDVSLDKTKWFTVEESMSILNVTQPRISHLLRSGKLKAYREGRRTYILKDSLQAYLATPRRAGRPKKVTTAEEGKTKTGSKKA